MLKTALLSSKRRFVYGFAALVMALTGTLALPISAQASVPSGTRQLEIYDGVAVIQWNQSTDNLTMYNSPGVLGSGKCTDAIFDWHRDDYNPLTSNHHDARILRVCKSGSSHSMNTGTDTGGSLLGMQKAGFCYGNDNATTSGSCVNASDAEQSVQGSDINVYLPNYCARGWKQSALGTNVYYSGGASTSCTS